MTNESKQQFTLRITQANSTELVVILYEMTLCYLEDVREAHRMGDKAEFLAAVRKMRGCINELLSSLHPEHEPAVNLQKLYLFCIRRLARAEVKNDPSFLDCVERTICSLKDAYTQIAPQNTNGAVMNHSQSVYAGLTYGRNHLTENMADEGTNRGMLV